MFKKLLVLVLFVSVLLSSDFEEYIEALNDEDFVKVNTIYQSKLNTQEFSNYQNRYFELITNNIFTNQQKSQELIDNIETFEYANPYFRYIKARFAISQDDYISALDILYGLKNEYMAYDLQEKVQKTQEVTINNYLVSLYEAKDYENLKNSIDLFMKYNDRDARDLWQITMIKSANNLIENKNFIIASNLLEKSYQYYLNTKNQKSFQIINNNLAYYYLEYLEKKEDINGIKEYIEYLTQIKDIENITYAKKIQNKIEEKLYISSIKGKKIPLEKKGNQYYLKAYINGVKVIFLIDTGASKTMINKTIATQFYGKILKKNIPIYTALGEGKADIVAVDSFVIDTIQLGYFELIVSKQDVFRDYDGLLGMNFLNKFHFQIDTYNKQLILN